MKFKQEAWNCSTIVELDLETTIRMLRKIFLLRVWRVHGVLGEGNFVGMDDEGRVYARIGTCTVETINAFIKPPRDSERCSLDRA